MAGRGGRGAQLLKALELPSRKPKNVGQFPQQPGQQPPQPGTQQQYQGQYGQQSSQGQQYPQQSQQYPQQYPQTQQGQQYLQQPQQLPQQYPQQTQQYPQQTQQYPQQTQQYPQQTQQYPQQGQQYPPQQYQRRDESQMQGLHPPQPRGQYQGQQPPQGQYPQQYQGQQPSRQSPGVMQQAQQQAPGGRGGMLSQAMQQSGQQRMQQPMGRGQIPQQSVPQQQYGQSALAGRGTSFTQVQQTGIRQPQTQPYTRGGGMPQSVSPPRQPTPRPVPSPGIQAPLSQPPPQQQTFQPPTQALQEMSIKQTDSSTQPGMRGTAGKQVQLAVNYIPLKCKVEGVYQYGVSFQPDIDSVKMRYQLLYTHSEFLGNTKGFDGIQLFLPRKLPQQLTVLRSVRSTDGAEIEVSIQFVKFVEVDKCVQLYNIIFRRVMRALQMQQVGRYYYDPTRPAQIPQHKLELWPGYITSIQHYEGGLMLLADISHKLLRTDCVLEIMTELFQQNKSNFEETATKMLVGSVVLTRYNNKTYRIDDVDWTKNPLSTFTFHTGEEMTYVDYYKQSYNRVIKDHYQPLLVHRPKKREQQKNGRRQLECVNLIPELCSMTGLTDAMRQDFRVMKDIAVHTRVSPMQREECSKKFLRNVNSNPKAKQILEDWGLELDSELLRAQGRLLAPEKIKFGSSTINGSPQADWGRDAVKENVITPVGLSSWMIIFSKRDQSKALDFVQTMKKVTPAMGISVNDPLVIEIRDDRTETYLRSIREHLNPNIQVVVIIFPTSRDDRYSAVKKLCCIECPVPSQVINARTISQQNKLRSVTQKIALQINCKLGGELWALDVPLKSLMVVGVDSYHDASLGGRSVGGFVASTNRSLTRWYSRVCFQTPGQELVDGLKMCLTSALKKYHEVNHTLPEKIVVFRDGVGDGQLNTVANYEVPQLSECFALFGETYQPQLAVIVVQKRINTRIFSFEARGGQHMLDNPGPGTVLDHSVTRKDWYDFFLVSQHVRQGTVTPTHYVVVHNTTSLKPDHVQRLSYKLTHLYYNWPGTVRVPAPCQYAHKIAYLVGTALHKDPALHLSDRLFYL